MDKIYIDIETIPGQADWIKEESFSTVSPPGQYKKQESIDKWMEENGEQAKEEVWRKTGLNGSRGEIICIAWAVNDGDIESVHRDLGGSEADLLRGFYAMLNASMDSQWVGHYISGFDLRFIWQRSVINKVKPSINIPYDAKPWGREVFDTKIEWDGVKSSGFGSLDSVCKALGYDGKGDIDGSKVWDYVKDGRIDEVVDYCKDDVEKARLLHKRMTFED